MQQVYGFNLQRNAVMMLDGMNIDSNWVDCHVNSRIYLLSICQLCSFASFSLEGSWRRSIEKEVQLVKQ